MFPTRIPTAARGSLSFVSLVHVGKKSLLRIRHRWRLAVTWSNCLLLKKKKTLRDVACIVARNTMFQWLHLSAATFELSTIITGHKLFENDIQI
jgi:hypothetical protein